MADFNLAINYVLDNEGGCCNNRNDPGGSTNFGILQRDWPQVDITKITRPEAIAWYQPNYWETVPYAGINSQQVATKLFDMHVNLGLSPAVMIAQKALGFSGPNVDGDMGPVTVDGINAADKAKFLAEIVSLLTLHYKLLEQRNPGLVAFDRGWMTRATKLPDPDQPQSAASAV